MSAEFIAWKKTPRLENEKYSFTEKIDGTNACVHVDVALGEITCQSRTTIITPEKDNYGFARWAQANKEELLKLGDGYHFGEWWGQGIQRNYGQDKKRFSLFYYPHELPTDVVERVPQLPYTVTTAQEALEFLKTNGSVAVPGWMKPEGAVRYSKLSNQRYKIILDK